MEGDVQGIKRALSDGADINTRMPMFLGSRGTDESMMPVCRNEPLGLTSLMYASNEGHVDAVKLLLRSRAKVDLQEADGMEAIHFAAQAECAKCFRALLDAGADPLAKDDSDKDALQYVPLDAICRTTARHEWLSLLKEAGSRPVLVAKDHAKDETDGHDAAVVDVAELQAAETDTMERIGGCEAVIANVGEVQTAERAMVENMDAYEAARANADAPQPLKVPPLLTSHNPPTPQPWVPAAKVASCAHKYGEAKAAAARTEESRKDHEHFAILDGVPWALDSVILEF
jgi:hypothetical protein